MHCDKISICDFFGYFKSTFGEKAFKEMVDSYCRGPLHPACRRLAYLEIRKVSPPVDLCPNGHKMDAVLNGGI